MTATLEELDDSVTVLKGQVKAMSHLAALAQGRYEIASEYMGYLHIEIKDLRRDLTTQISRLDERIDRIEERMDRLEERVDRLDERMGRIEERMDKLEVRMNRFEERMDRFEERQIGQDAILKSHGEMLQELLRRLPPAA